MAPTEQEIAELYERYAHVVFHRARSILRSDEAAQDAVQETFARVIRNWESFRGDASPLTWMYRITTNWSLNQIRNRKTRDGKHVANKEDIVGDGVSWMRPGHEAEMIRQLLEDADEETRSIVIHLFFDDMSREETAVLVGLSVPTVRKRLNQFLARARRAMGGSTVPAILLLLACAGLLTALRGGQS